MSPFEVQFGLPAITALHASTAKLEEDLQAPVPTAMAHELQQLLDLARSNIGTCRTQGDYSRRLQAERANAAGRRKTPVEYRLGDLVMMFREPKADKSPYYVKPADFSPKWIGPFLCIQQTGTVFRLMAVMNGNGMDAGEVVERAVMNLKPFHGFPASMTDEELEALVPQRKVNVKIEVLVPAGWVVGEPVMFSFAARNWTAQPPPTTKPNTHFIAVFEVDVVELLKSHRVQEVATVTGVDGNGTDADGTAHEAAGASDGDVADQGGSGASTDAAQAESVDSSNGPGRRSRRLRNKPRRRYK